MTPAVRAVTVTTGVVTGLIALTGCGGSPSPATASAAGSTTHETVIVYAAASLVEVFTEIADGFESQNPGFTVKLSFAGSADLASQIIEGAPADVLASADQSQMRTVSDAGLTASAPIPFATNVPTIVVPADNPARVASFADLANPDVATVVCAPQVPCGAAELAVERATGVDVSPVSEESSVTEVLGKVTSGQADAGVVYVTDAARAGDAVVGIDIAGADAARTTYPIAPIAGAGPASQAFVDYVAGPAGQSVLAAAGFGAP